MKEQDKEHQGFDEAIAVSTGLSVEDSFQSKPSHITIHKKMAIFFNERADVFILPFLDRSDHLKLALRKCHGVFLSLNLFLQNDC